MRRVKILKLEREGNAFKKRETGEIGYFHQFGTDYEEHSTGPGQYSTALIELPTGEVRNIPTNLIVFIDSPEE